MARELHPVHSVLKTIIEQTILGHERSHQVALGPSELGTPCNRKLVYKLARAAAGDPGADTKAAWRPTVGTAVHSWLEKAVTAANDKDLKGHRVKDGVCQTGWCDYDSEGGVKKHRARFSVERKVVVGTLDDEDVVGTLDVFDWLTHVLVDYKIIGPTSIKDYARHGIPEDYRGAIQLYARGLVHEGVPVKEVAFYLLPSNGELDDGIFKVYPYDPEVGKRLMKRARAFTAALAERGAAKLIPVMSTANDHCNHCPWWAPGVTVDEFGCPGDPSLYSGDAKAPDSFSDLLG